MNFGCAMWIVPDGGPEFWVKDLQDQDCLERAFGSALGILIDGGWFSGIRMFGVYKPYFGCF